MTRPTHAFGTALGARIFVLPLALLFCLAPALVFAAGAEGDWWVHDKQARIRIANCDGLMWGVISWEAKPGTDTHNPDASKRNRPMLGVPIIIAMMPAGPNKWSGSVYNAAFGQNVSGGIALNGPDTLRITGCILGVFCGGENWTRAESDPSAETSKAADAAEAVCKSVAQAGR